MQHVQSRKNGSSYLLILPSTGVIDVSDDTIVQEQGSIQTKPSTKRKASLSTASGRRLPVGPNTKPLKERQPNWSSAEVVGLTRAKEKEHEDAKLVGDDREPIESASLKWNKVAAFVQNLQVSEHYRGP